MGLRLLEILCFREKGSKRDVRLLDILKFVHSTLWKYLFGRQARDLEQSNTVRQHALTSWAVGMLMEDTCRACLHVGRRTMST